MAFFKLNSTDISAYVSALKIGYNYDYIENKNANGDSLVDYINMKRAIEVTIIPLTAADYDTFKSQLQFETNISFLNPDTNTLETNVACILPKRNIEYYTIQANNKEYKGFTLTYQEL